MYKRFIKPLLITSGVIIVFSCRTNDAAPESQGDTDSPEILRLADFDPVSLYNVPRSTISRARFPIIDLHSHPYADSEEELEAWVNTMDDVGVDKTAILTYATGEKFDSLYQVYSKYGDRFILFCGFDYTGYDQPGFGPAAVKELERCFKVGARGVGELGDNQYPNLTADIAARFGEVAPIPRFVRKFYHKYQDRLVYGTDMGMDKEMYQLTFRILESEDEHFYEGFNYHWALNGIGLSTEVLEKYTKEMHRLS